MLATIAQQLQIRISNGASSFSYFPGRRQFAVQYDCSPSPRPGVPFTFLAVSELVSAAAEVGLALVRAAAPAERVAPEEQLLLGSTFRRLDRDAASASASARRRSRALRHRPHRSDRSCRGQIQVRQGSDRGQTGVRQRSDRTRRGLDGGVRRELEQVAKIKGSHITLTSSLSIKFAVFQLTVQRRAALI